MAVITMEGALSKWTNVMKGWQYRWFVLDDSAGLLSYYTSKERMTRGVRRGCVRLKGAVIGIDDEDEATFTVTVDGKVFHFQAQDATERERWVRALEDTILTHAARNHGMIAGHRSRWDPRRPVPTMKDFDLKVTEADAYLQMLIDQMKVLDERIENTINPEQKQQLEGVRSQGNEMLECIKHSIVLLQIAKNTAFPINGIYQGPTDIAIEAPRIPHRNTLHEAYCMAMVRPSDDSDIQTGIELARECQEKVDISAPVGADLSVRSSVSLPVPTTSYSSSEEEDLYYDANDDSVSQVMSVAQSFEDAVEITPVQCASKSTSRSSGRRSISQRKSNPSDADYSMLDYDAMYEDESDDELNSMEGHGSVISHLLSQVKIGMDLTKVVLPTFILERRSLLEMYADFFAHPDIFLSVNRQKTPQDRLVQVLRWYLSAFHAGRRSAVGKKPYNPILGETFFCRWDVPSPSPKQRTTPEQPHMTWCDKNQLGFVAEQVSHHPPISAFYAEHFEENISFCAHIWTKSKFLGLSVCVHNIGQGCVSLPDWNEEYIVTFPNGYGRSILTVPWIELGGSVQITCPQTGYSANVEFITKPFYGGKRNRITAEAFGPEQGKEKKPFLTVSGEWSGAMMAKWAADGKTEVFVDVSKISIIRKVVKPIATQEECESRRLWKEVTAGLKLNDIDRASTSKFALEQKQREEAQKRKDAGVEWQTKMFHRSGENWLYDQRLDVRIAAAEALSATNN